MTARKKRLVHKSINAQGHTTQRLTWVGLFYPGGELMTDMNGSPVLLPNMDAAHARIKMGGWYRDTTPEYVEIVKCRKS